MDPDAREPPGPGATARAVTPSLWSRIVANGAKPETRPPASNAAASWTRTAVSAADAVTTCCPQGPHAAEQRAGEAASPICAPHGASPRALSWRSFGSEDFLVVLGRMGMDLRDWEKESVPATGKEWRSIARERWFRRDEGGIPHTCQGGEFWA